MTLCAARSSGTVKSFLRLKTGAAPERQRQAGDHQGEEHEVHVEAGRRPGSDDGHEPEEKPSAQVFQQEECEHEGNHGAVPGQGQKT